MNMTTKSTSRLSLPLLCALFAVSALPSLASDYTYWNGSVDSNWNTPGNWDKGLPSDTVYAQFGDPYDTPFTLSVDDIFKVYAFSISGSRRADLTFTGDGTLEIYRTSDIVVTNGGACRLTFDVNRQKSDVILQEEVSMRISNRFPFMRLTLIVEQTVYPAGNTMTDTLDCSLIDEQGVFLGYGTSQYQYLFPLKTIELHRGDSLHVAIRHDMKREILPGVTSVGIKIEKK